ncbi:hypothetical protein [Salininema proteolyticum]|uniref:Uncharacterized protein n=1 Tax=Salininema proteolyticum TaxID=1607685 RepID=A0ABV8TVK9_9ACTN
MTAGTIEVWVVDRDGGRFERAAVEAQGEYTEVLSAAEEAAERLGIALDKKARRTLRPVPRGEDGLPRRARIVVAGGNLVLADPVEKLRHWTKLASDVAADLLIWHEDGRWALQVATPMDDLPPRPRPRERSLRAAVESAEWRELVDDWGRIDKKLPGGTGRYLSEVDGVGWKGSSLGGIEALFDGGAGAAVWRNGAWHDVGERPEPDFWGDPVPERECPDKSTSCPSCAGRGSFYDGFTWTVTDFAGFTDHRTVRGGPGTPLPRSTSFGDPRHELRNVPRPRDVLFDHGIDYALVKDRRNLPVGADFLDAAVIAPAGSSARDLEATFIARCTAKSAGARGYAIVSPPPPDRLGSLAELVWSMGGEVHAAIRDETNRRNEGTAHAGKRWGVGVTPFAEPFRPSGVAILHHSLEAAAADCWNRFPDVARRDLDTPTGHATVDTFSERLVLADLMSSLSSLRQRVGPATISVRLGTDRVSAVLHSGRRGARPRTLGEAPDVRRLAERLRDSAEGLFE